uniref:Conserved plasma membrane protein n=1 Tax=Enterobius vermicularis TaxID=51028 RepID=A0A0N4VLJ4_ENTVE
LKPQLIYNYIFSFFLGVISVLVILICIVLLLIAIKTENAYLLIPHLFAQVFLILFSLIVVLIVFLLIVFRSWNGIRNLLGYGDYKVNNESTEMTGYALILLHLLVAALEAVFLYIVFRLYRYLQDYELLRYRHTYWTDSDIYKTHWQTPMKTAPYGRGSPEAGDVYPYGP